MDAATKARQLAAVLAPSLMQLSSSGDVHANGHVSGLQLDNRAIDRLVAFHLQELVKQQPISQALKRLPHRGERGERSPRGEFECLLRRDDEQREALWVLLSSPTAGSAISDALHSGQLSKGSGSAPRSNGPHSAQRWRRLRRLTVLYIRRGSALLFMAVIIAAAILGTWLIPDKVGGLTPLKILAVSVLAFLPGWLYVRFMGQRRDVLWNEYVLNLHRLGVDRPQHLPEPPRNSIYYTAWWRGGGMPLSRLPNIYRQKFEAYYGKSVPVHDDEKPRRVRAETLFPVFLSTAIVAVGWLAVLWDDGFFLNPPTSAIDALRYGFLGAYSFIVQMLVRRYFQSDLKAGAYTSAVVRILTVLILVLVLHQLPLWDRAPTEEAIVAFLVGFFPLVGMQALQRAAAVALRVVVPSLRVDYPLSDLDGLNIWYEARLLEEGIEDMQNLATANLVDVILHTRVPVGRLVDWVDQAHLYLHLEPMDARGQTRRAPQDASSRHPRKRLRQLGIRNATDLIGAFADGWGSPTDPELRRRLEGVLGKDDRSPSVTELLPKLLEREQNLRPVRNWRRPWSEPK